MNIEDVQSLLQQVIGSQVRVARAKLLKDRLDYRVWAIDLSTPALQLVVKLGGPKAEYSCSFEHTAAVLRLVRDQAHLPVPEVLAADESYRKWPWRYMIRTYVPGQDWADVAGQIDRQSLEGVRAELGSCVASLHQITFDGFGTIDIDGAVRSRKPYGEALTRHARQIIRDPAAQDFFLEALHARWDLFEDVGLPSLCHEDLHPYNILLQEGQPGWQIAAILDFEKAWAGHCESDLARMDLWGMTGESFWKAYRQGCPVFNGYAARRPWYQLLWCLEFAKQTREHLRTTQAICQELGIAGVVQFRPTFRCEQSRATFP